ncbi:MAG: sterol desaturase family protein, partial [Mesorhizobium sp.]
YQSLFGLYILPLRKMGGHVRKLFQRRPDAIAQDRSPS